MKRYVAKAVKWARPPGLERAALAQYRRLPARKKQAISRLAFREWMRALEKRAEQREQAVSPVTFDREDALCTAATRAIQAAGRRRAAQQEEAAARASWRALRLDRALARRMVISGALTPRDLAAMFPRPN